MSEDRQPQVATAAGSDAKVVIVGAGPAGVRAAETLAAAGVRPIVIDENRLPGGQIYRQPPRGFTRSAAALYGFEASRATRIHQTFSGLVDKVDYRPDTLVWHATRETLDVLTDVHTPSATLATVPYTHLLLCTGAMDRMLPFDGWTLPGVYTLGAAQVALKSQGCAIGRRVVLAGAGPLLYLVAYQYARAGVTVAAVLDASAAPPASITASPAAPARRSDAVWTRWRRQLRAVPDLIQAPAVLAKGLYYLGWLRAHGIPIHHDISGLSAHAAGDAPRLARVGWQRGAASAASAAPLEIECDALAVSFGLRSESQLADLAGCAFEFDTVNRQWAVRTDAEGRSSVPGVYLAGDGHAIAGADAAELAGRRAARALLHDLGRPVAAAGSDLTQQAQRIRRFRSGIEAVFTPPFAWAAQAADTLVVCRCEEITAGEIRQAAQLGAREMNRMKALCRVGMGRCQGRVCAAAAAEILADATGQTVIEVGRLRAQPPLKPLPASALIAMSAAAPSATAVLTPGIRRDDAPARPDAVGRAR